MNISYTLTPAQIASLREDFRVTGLDPREDKLVEHANKIVEMAFDSLRDRWKIDAKKPQVFTRSIPPNKYANILIAAEQYPQLAEYLNELDEAPLVWLGSPKVQAGINTLVAFGLLTQEDAEQILRIEMPPLPQ